MIYEKRKKVSYFTISIEQYIEVTQIIFLAARPTIDGPFDSGCRNYASVLPAGQTSAALFPPHRLSRCPQLQPVGYSCPQEPQPRHPPPHPTERKLSAFDS